MKSRKTDPLLLAALLFGFAILLAACGPAATEAPEEPEEPAAAATEPAAEQPAEPGTLSVLEWAYYEVPEMWVEFGLEHPEVEVTFNFGADDPEIFAKTLAGSGEDIIHLYTPFLQFYVDEGLVQPIDTSKLANWDKIPQGFADSCTIDDVVYCVPWDWGFASILYRTDKIPDGVDSWTALFDEQYAGHISMFDDGPSAVAVSTYILGYDEQNLSDAQLDEIKQMWLDQANLNLFYWGDEASLEAGFTSEDIWIAYAWNGAYYRLLSAGVPVDYIDPSEGRIAGSANTPSPPPPKTMTWPWSSWTANLVSRLPPICSSSMRMATWSRSTSTLSPTSSSSRRFRWMIRVSWTAPISPSRSHRSTVTASMSCGRR